MRTVSGSEMSLSHNSHPCQVHDKTLRNYLGNTPVSLSISLHPLFWARISAPNILPPAVFLIPPGSRRRPGRVTQHRADPENQRGQRSKPPVLGSPDSSGFPCPTCPVAGLFAALGLVGSFVVGNFALCTNPLGRSLLRNAEVEVYPKTVNVWRPPSIR